MKFWYSSALLILCVFVSLEGMGDSRRLPKKRLGESRHHHSRSLDDAHFRATPQTQEAMESAVAAAAGMHVTKGEIDPFNGDDASMNAQGLSSGSSSTMPISLRSSIESDISSIDSGVKSRDSFAGSASEDEDNNDSFIPPARHSSKSDIRKSGDSDLGDPYRALSDGDESDDDQYAAAGAGKPPRNNRPARPVVHKGGIPLSRLCKWGLGAFVAYKIIDSFFEKNDDPDEDDGK